MRISDWSSDVCSSDLDGEADLGVRNLHRHHDLGIVHELLEFADRLARNDDAWHAFRSGRGVEVGAGKAVAVRRHCAQLQITLRFDCVEKYAVDRKSTRLNSSH